MPVFDDYEDTNSIRPTFLDVERIEVMVFGDKISAENGNWEVIKYSSGYTLLLQNHVRENSYLEFKNLNDLLEFLRTK